MRKALAALRFHPVSPRPELVTSSPAASSAWPLPLIENLCIAVALAIALGLDGIGLTFDDLIAEAVGRAANAIRSGSQKRKYGPSPCRLADAANRLLRLINSDVGCGGTAKGGIAVSPIMLPGRRLVTSDMSTSNRGSGSNSLLRLGHSPPFDFAPIHFLASRLRAAAPAARHKAADHGPDGATHPDRSIARND